MGSSQTKNTSSSALKSNEATLKSNEPTINAYVSEEKRKELEKVEQFLERLEEEKIAKKIEAEQHRLAMEKYNAAINRLENEDLLTIDDLPESILDKNSNLYNYWTYKTYKSIKPNEIFDNTDPSTIHIINPKILTPMLCDILLKLSEKNLAKILIIYKEPPNVHYTTQKFDLNILFNSYSKFSTIVACFPSKQIIYNILKENHINEQNILNNCISNEENVFQTRLDIKYATPKYILCGIVDISGLENIIDKLPNLILKTGFDIKIWLTREQYNMFPINKYSTIDYKEKLEKLLKKRKAEEIKNVFCEFLPKEYLDEIEDTAVVPQLKSEIEGQEGAKANEEGQEVIEEGQEVIEEDQEGQEGTMEGQ